MRSKRPSSRLRFITRGEQNQLLDHLRGHTSYRDYALVVLCLRTGLSPSEALNLNVGHIFKGDAIVNNLEVGTNCRWIRNSEKLSGNTWNGNQMVKSRYNLTLLC